ncbi:acetyltransferase [Ectopseudomonas mendocina DLHK]|nr:acetyltransferase [Pseudomonas mendocina DLHK]
MDQIEEARKYISAAEAVFVAGMWSYQTQSEAFNRALHVFLRDMKSQGKAVYIMPQVAQFDYSPQRARRFHYLGMSEQVQLDMGFLRANDFLRSTLKGREGVVYLELDSSGLFAQAPFYRGDLIYFDEHHLNEVGAVLYGEKSRESFISLTRLGRE